MDNSLFDFFGLALLFVGGGAVLWFLRVRIKAWWDSK